MGEELLSHDNNFLLDVDQSWSFPILDGEEEEEEEAPPPPPPPTGAKGKKRTATEEGGDGGDDHDQLHIWTERERRKKMRNMFANLHALLPHIPPKADKSTIVDEAVKQIKKLQQSVEQLEKRKLQMINNINNPMISTQLRTREAFLADQGSTLASPNPVFPGPVIFKTWTSSNVVMNICGKDAHISICSPKKPGLLTCICFVIEKHNLEILSAQVSSDHTKCIYMIQTRVANGGSDHQHQAFVEEIYKQAATELMLWVNSY